LIHPMSEHKVTASFPRNILATSLRRTHFWSSGDENTRKHEGVNLVPETRTGSLRVGGRCLCSAPDDLEPRDNVYKLVVARLGQKALHGQSGDASGEVLRGRLEPDGVNHWDCEVGEGAAAVGVCAYGDVL